MSEKSLAARAWDATKTAEDPTFYNVAGTFRQELDARAADVVKTGITNNKFEETVAKLNAADTKDAPETSVGTTEVKFNAANEEGAKVGAKVKAAAKVDNAK